MHRVVLIAGLLAALAQDLPVLPIGRGDVIEVTVEGEDDLTKQVTVSSAGEIALPLLKDHVPVAGLLPDAIEKRIATAYKDAQLLIDPIVRVKPVEYHSYLVKVTGAVTTPYEFQALEPVPLKDVIARAGGPALNSNGQIEIIRRDPDTKQTISLKALLEDPGPDNNPTLRGGEEVHLPESARPPDKLM